MAAFRGSWGGLTSRKTDNGSAGSTGLVDFKLFCSTLELPWHVVVVLEIFLVMSW